ncbi:MAG TPA: hypothetical protein VFI44_06935, partial [Ornithinibacter sp.]|nr:hypothetical protein [Ornithinibacter sp.]
MTDDLDVLRHERAVVEPDPQFRAELMERVRSEMSWRHEPVPVTRTDTALDDERTTLASLEPYVSAHPRRRGRRWLAVAAVVLLVATVATVVAVIRDGEGERGVDTLPLAITDLARGETIELPRGPFAARSGPAVVWTGSEMIVWGGDGERLDGAAFDPATGAWREIAPAPLEPRASSRVVWTGTEML